MGNLYKNDSSTSKPKTPTVKENFPANTGNQPAYFPAGRQIHRKAGCSCGGGCPSCRSKSSNLSVSQPNDAAEIEADHIADKVMRMSTGETAPVTKLQTAKSHRKCEKCEDDEKILRKESGSAKSSDDSAASVNDVLNSSGHPLNSETREFFESRFGQDFSSVRVHSDSGAAASARMINAKAYTVGNHIVFGSGYYKPETTSGKKLLAHELTHVVQQSLSTQEKPPLQKESDEGNSASGGSNYSVGDALKYLNTALSMAANTLGGDESLSSEKRAKIEDQMLKLEPVREQLKNAGGTKGEGITFGFDPDPKENEINAGDSEKGVGELLANLTTSSPEQTAIAGGAENTSGEMLQAKALPGGLNITPVQSPAIQRDGGATIVIILILTGLLASGCSKDEPNPPPPSAPPPTPPAPPSAPTAAPSGSAPPAASSRNAPAPPPPPQQAFSCPAGYKDLGDFTITIYILAQEKDFPEKPTVTDPCGLKGTYRQDFLTKTDKCPRGVKMQGSGLALNGKIIHYKKDNCFEELDCPKTRSGTCATAGRTVAVDKPADPSKTQPGEIKLKHELIIEDFGNRTAEDIGGSINQAHIDIYYGTEKNCSDAEKFGRQKKKVCRKLIKK